jgi:Cleaved Adhesin Domain/Outer membrane protein Omp28/Secretion system C-terminal sorting domain
MKNILFSILLWLALSNSFAQIHFSEDFNAGIVNWTLIDGDADPVPASGTNFDIWYTANYSALDTSFGLQSAVSRSYAGSMVYHPNNYLISPPINLSSASATGLSLVFSVGTFESAPFHAEHYAVYVSTSLDTNSILASAPIFEETLSNPASTDTKIINLSAYVGQTIYLTFRHYNTVDMNSLIVDNVFVKNLAADDAKLISSSLKRYAPVNTNNTLSLLVKNEGYNTITSLEVDWNDGIAHVSTITGLNIITGATAVVNHPISISSPVPVEKNISLTILQVNGNADATPANNVGSTKFNTVSTVVPKVVVIEEGTGTWCGWCPRGAVAMEALTLAHPDDFVGIAVHNGDLMMVTEYNDGAGIFGFPGANVDRELLGVSVSETAFNQYYNDRVALTVPAKVTIDGTLSGNTMNLVAGTEFFTPISNANFRLAVVISEDDVTGTDSDYDQSNYYSYQSQNVPLIGAGHNWQQEPNPVPAVSMDYDHVGRALLGGYAGLVGSVPTTVVDGTTGSASFSYTIPTSSNISKMHATALLLDATTGAIVNAKSSKLNALLDMDEVEQAIVMTVYPNPASDLVYVTFQAKGGNYTLSARDIAGVTISTLTLTEVRGQQSASFPLINLAAGVYFITVSHNGASSTKRIFVQ